MLCDIQIETKTETRLTPRYNLVLINDEFHTYNYVVEMLMDLFKFEIEEAIIHTVEVDKLGRSIVYNGPLEHAEMKQEQIHNYGCDIMVANCEGSMTAELESMD